MLEQTLGNLSSHTNLSYGDHLYFGSSKLLTDKSLDGKKKKKKKSFGFHYTLNMSPLDRHSSLI